MLDWEKVRFIECRLCGGLLDYSTEEEANLCGYCVGRFGNHLVGVARALGRSIAEDKTEHFLEPKDYPEQNYYGRKLKSSCRDSDLCLTAYYGWWEIILELAPEPDRDAEFIFWIAREMRRLSNGKKPPIGKTARRWMKELDDSYEAIIAAR